jgi:hypothetical protein
MRRFIQTLSIATFILLFIVSCTREPISDITDVPYRPYDLDCRSCSYNLLCDGAFFQYRSDTIRGGVTKKDTLNYHLTKLSDSLVNNKYVYSLYARTDVPIYDFSVLSDISIGGFLSKHHVDSLYISCSSSTLRQIDKSTRLATKIFITDSCAKKTDVNHSWSDVFAAPSPISRIDYKFIKQKQVDTIVINGYKQLYNTVSIIQQYKYDNTKPTPKLISRGWFYYSKLNGLIRSSDTLISNNTTTAVINQVLLSKPIIP